MGIEKDLRNKDKASKQLEMYLSTKNISKEIVKETLGILERSYEQLKTDIQGRYYSGCCI